MFNAFVCSEERKNILFIGDSLTSGYGLDKGNDFVSELTKITKKYNYDFNLINMGVSGDTTSGGLSRLNWSISPNTRGIVILLGANDMLRGISPKITKKNLKNMIDICLEKNIPVMLVGQTAPDNFGLEYKSQFDKIFKDLKNEYEILLYPSFFQVLLQNNDLNTLNKYLLEDRIHPNSQGIKKIVFDFKEVFFKFLKKL